MMDEADEEWLSAYNKAHPKLLLSEDAFEAIMFRIESITLEKVPYLETVSASYSARCPALCRLYPILTYTTRM